MKDKLGNHIQQVRGVSYKPNDLSETLSDGYITLLRANNISEGKINFDSVQFVSSSKVSSEQILKTNDILVCSSSGSLSLVGKSALYKKTGEHTFGAFCKVVRATGKLLPQYIAFYMCSQAYRRHIENIANGANINNLRNEHLDDILLPIPSETKQNAIITKLEKVESVISHRRTQLAKLDELVKCRFVELFGEPLAPKAKWKTTSFGSEFEIFSGGTPSTSVSEYWDNGTIPWIGSNMCQDVILSSTDGKYITEEGFNKSSAKWAHAGYVIVALVGATIGKTALLTISTTTNQNVASVNVPGNTNYTPEYVYMLMRFLYAKFMELGNGGFKMANLGFIRQLPLPSPPIDLQREYSDFMNRINKLRFVIHKSLNETQKLFDSLMQEYFD